MVRFKVLWTATRSLIVLILRRLLLHFLVTLSKNLVHEFWQKLTKAADGDESYLGEAFLLQCLAAIIEYDQFVVTMRGLRESQSKK